MQSYPVALDDLPSRSSRIIHTTVRNSIFLPVTIFTKNHANSLQIGFMKRNFELERPGFTQPPHFDRYRNSQTFLKYSYTRRFSEFENRFFDRKKKKFELGGQLREVNMAYYLRNFVIQLKRTARRGGPIYTRVFN